MDRDDKLPITAYIVLTLLAEGEAHGYELQRLIHERGFRFWTDIQRSSIYNALKRLEGQGLVRGDLRQGGGPPRKVYAITDSGMQAMRDAANAFLGAPRHPRNEIDLGVLALPFFELSQARDMIEQGAELLAQREAFVAHQLRWCEERELQLPSLNFDRPLRSIATDRKWLQALLDRLDARADPPPAGEWQAYEYLEPPYIDKEDPGATVATVSDIDG